jgi:hypothetical protein
VLACFACTLSVVAGWSWTRWGYGVRADEIPSVSCTAATSCVSTSCTRCTRPVSSATATGAANPAANPTRYDGGEEIDGTISRKRICARAGPDVHV